VVRPFRLNRVEAWGDRAEQHGTHEHPGHVRDHVAEGRRPGRQQHTLDRLDQQGRHEAVRRPGASATRGNAIEPARLTAATIAAFISRSSLENVANDGATPSEVSTCTSQTTATLGRSEVG
jgi:hypothetical protein